MLYDCRRNDCFITGREIFRSANLEKLIGKTNEKNSIGKINTIKASIMLNIKSYFTVKKLTWFLVFLSIASLLASLYTFNRIRQIDAFNLAVSTAKTPATDKLFVYNSGCTLLTKSKQAIFHLCVMELHYLGKRIRGDILCAVSYLATRILSPNEDDEKKLERILCYLHSTSAIMMILRIGNSLEINAYVDASFGIYDDMKSVTGVIIKIWNATIYVKSGKQKLLTRSSTEAELVGVSDALSQIIWTREFLLCQGLKLQPAKIYQDNLSTIFLASKGRSTSERTRHVKIRYFFIHHFIETGEVQLSHLATTLMIADLLTKPLHGTLFLKFRSELLGHLSE